MDPTGIHRWGPGPEPPAEIHEAAPGRRPWILIGRAVLVLAKLANFLVPFAAGLWLALRGHRFEAGAGLAMGIAFPIAWSLVAFRPAHLIAGLLTHRGEPGPWRATITCLLATGLQYCFLAAWTLAVFRWFGERSHPGNELAILVWAYGAVMGPFAWMAGGDHGADSAPSLALGFALAACAVNAALVHWTIPLGTSAAALGLLAGAGAAVNAALAGRAAARMRRGVATGRAQLQTVGRTLHGILARDVAPGE